VKQSNQNYSWLLFDCSHVLFRALYRQRTLATSDHPNPHLPSVFYNYIQHRLLLPSLSNWFHIYSDYPPPTFSIMAKKTASPIRSPAPTRESPEAERSDDQTTDGMSRGASPGRLPRLIVIPGFLAPSPALGDVKRSTSKERKRKAIEPPGSPRDSRGRSSSNETQHSDDCEPEAKEHSPGASVEPLDSPEDPTERPSSIKDQTCDGCDPEVEHQAPGASVEPVDSADDQGSCASDGKTKQCIPSAEPSDQRYWGRCPS
jgi:hypothetical protein